MIVPFESVLSSEDGIWKRVVEPFAATLNTEVVANPALVGDWMSNNGINVFDEVAATVRIAVGEVVPMPTVLVDEKRIVSILLLTAANALEPRL